MGSEGSANKPFGGESFALEDMAFTLNLGQEDWALGVGNWAICEGSDPYLKYIDLENGILAHAIPLAPREWKLSLWMSRPCGDSTELALEVLSASHAPTWQDSVYVDSNQGDEGTGFHALTDGNQVIATSNDDLPATELSESEIALAELLDEGRSNIPWTAEQHSAYQALFALSDSVSTMTRILYWNLLESCVPGMKIDWAGGAVPFQSEGTVFGYPYYFRMRNEKASLQVGSNDPVSGALWAAVEVDEDEYGHLAWPKFAAVMHSLIRRLTRVPQLYYFPLVDKETGLPLNTVNVDQAGAEKDSSTVAAWGTTEEEAHSIAVANTTLLDDAHVVVGKASLNLLEVGFPAEDPDFAGIQDLP